MKDPVSPAIQIMSQAAVCLLFLACLAVTYLTGAEFFTRTLQSDAGFPGIVCHAVAAWLIALAILKGSRALAPDKHLPWYANYYTGSVPYMAALIIGSICGLAYPAFARTVPQFPDIPTVQVNVAYWGMICFGVLLLEPFGLKRKPKSHPSGGGSIPFRLRRPHNRSISSFPFDHEEDNDLFNPGFDDPPPISRPSGGYHPPQSTPSSSDSGSPPRRYD